MFKDTVSFTSPMLYVGCVYVDIFLMYIYSVVIVDIV